MQNCTIACQRKKNAGTRISIVRIPSNQERRFLTRANRPQAAVATVTRNMRKAAHATLHLPYLEITVSVILVRVRSSRVHWIKQFWVFEEARVLVQHGHVASLPGQSDRLAHTPLLPFTQPSHVLLVDSSAKGGQKLRQEARVLVVELRLVATHEADRPRRLIRVEFAELHRLILFAFAERRRHFRLCQRPRFRLSRPRPEPGGHQSADNTPTTIASLWAGDQRRTIAPQKKTKQRRNSQRHDE